jgi:hypothetical protein
MLPFGITIPATVPQKSEIPEGLMNYPVYKSTENIRMDKKNDGEQDDGVENNCKKKDW